METPESRLAQIDAELTTTRSELVGFADLGDLDETQSTRFGSLETRLDELTAERETVARRAATIQRAREALSAGNVNDAGPAASRAPEVQSRVQPFADLDRVRAGQLTTSDLRSRALAAVEQAPDYVDDAAREAAERLLRRNDRHGRIARHVLMTGSEDYARGFEDVLTGVKPWNLDADAARAMQLADEHNRGILEGTDTAGGFLVPFYLDPTVISTNAGTVNPFRQISRQVTISTNKWHGITSAGVTAEWLGEAVEVGDHSPTVTQPEVDVRKASSWVQASFEALQDTSVAASLGEMLQVAKDNLEAAAHATGSGTGNVPQGVITGLVAAGGSTLVAAGTDGTYAVGDVFKLKNSLPAKWRRNGVWVASPEILDSTRLFATGTGQQSGAFWADLAADTPPKLLGRPVYESSEMDATLDASAANYVLLYGDFSNYLIVDRIGMSVQYEPLVKGTNRRPTGEVGWYAHWRTGAGVLNPAAFRLLNV